jgi:hypothetical protein
MAALFTIARLWKQPRCPIDDDWIRCVWPPPSSCGPGCPGSLRHLCCGGGGRGRRGAERARAPRGGEGAGQGTGWQLPRRGGGSGHGAGWTFRTARRPRRPNPTPAAAWRAGGTWSCGTCGECAAPSALTWPGWLGLPGWSRGEGAARTVAGRCLSPLSCPSSGREPRH